jgi:hypothetical protein
VVLPTISINPIDGNNRINPAQASAGVFITGSTTAVENGSTVTVQIVNASNVVVDTLHASVANNAWSASLTTAQANALVGGLYTVKADVTNVAGNAAPEATVTLGQIPIDLYFNGFAGSDDWTTNITDADSGAIIYTNWTGNEEPYADNVEIGPGAPGEVVIGSNVYEHTNIPLDVNALVVDSGKVLDQNSGPLSVDSLLSVSGQFNVTNSVLVVGGELSTPGNLALIGGGAQLQLTGNVVFDGAGSVTLAQGYITGSSLAATANIENYGTINGAGLIGVYNGQSALLDHNYGVVDATEDTYALTIAPPSATPGDAIHNSGTLEDTGAAGLALNNALVIQSATGVIAANGDGAHVDLNSSIVEGGLLSSTGTGQIEALAGTSTLDSSTSAGVVTNLGNLVAINSVLNLVGPLFHNNGAIIVDEQGGYSTLALDPGGVTFDGAGGDIFMTDSGLNQITGGTLTLAGGLLGGGGTVSTNVVNTAQGTIGTFVNAINPIFDNNNTALTFNGASLVNAGWIIDGSIGHIVFSGVTVYQKIGSATGRIDTELGAVDLSNAVIQGGVLIGSSTGVVETAGGGSILDSTSTAGVISNSNVIDIRDGSDLLFKGTFHNSGAIKLDAAGGYTTMIVDLVAGVTLDSGGVVTLTDSGLNQIQASSGMATLTNVDNTISGGGSFDNLTIVNQAKGVINADGVTSQLSINMSNTLLNHGLLEATGAAGLALAGQTIDSALGGTILAATGSRIDLSTVTLKGGTLKTAGTGFWSFDDASSVLDGSTNSGAITNASLLKVHDGSALTIKGTIHNSGTMELDGGGGYTTLVVDSTSGATLDQSGAIALSDSGLNQIQAATTATTLTNVDDSISGSGSFNNLTIINQVGGVINATGAAAQLTFNASDVLLNHGTVEATGAAGLSLIGQTIDSGLGGTILAATGSRIDLSTVTLKGGTLKTVGTGSWNFDDAASILDGSTASGAVTNASLVKVRDGSALTLKGSIHNSGAFELDGDGGYTTLIIDSTSGVTLDSAGKVTLGDSGLNQIQASGGVATLTNVDDSISGSGSFNNLIIVNQTGGVINATGAAAQLVINASDTLQNHGLLEATGAAGLSLIGQTIDTALGGTIVAATGSRIDLSTVTLEGGTLKTAGTGSWNFDDASSILDGSTASGAITNASLLKVQDGSALTLKGTIHNGGTFELDGAGGYTTLVIDQTSGATLDKAGKIVLSDSGLNQIQSNGSLATLTNVDDSISGSGAFNNLAIINQTAGVINAKGLTAQLSINASDTLQNHGLLEATGAAGLSIASQTIDNTGGDIYVGTGSKAQLYSDQINLGTLQTSGTGVIEIADSGTTLSAQNVAQGLTLLGKIQIDDGLSTVLVGSIVNKGSLFVGATGAATLNIGATLAGVGSVVLFDSAKTSVVGGLNNVSNTIMGAGSITAAVQQQVGGILEATDADNALILNTGAAVANAGLLEANGGELMVDDAVTGSGRGLVTGGGELRFASSFDQNVTFQGANAGALALSKATYGGTISGLVGGDKIDLSGLAFAAGAVASATGGVLTVTSGAVSETLKIAGAPPSGFIVTKDSAGGSLVTAATSATVAQFQANGAALDALPTGFVIIDTAARVAAALDGLNADTHIAAITLTDSGIPTLALTAGQVAADAAALGKITNQNLAIAVTDTTANVATRQAALNANAHVASISITNGAGALNGAAGVKAASLSETGASTAVTLSSALTYAGALGIGAGATLGLTGGDLTLSGKASFTGGVVNGPNTMTTKLSATVAGLTIGGGTTWVNTKTATQAGGALKLGDASTGVATLTNNSGASYSIGDDTGISRGAAAGSSIANAGLFAKTAGTGVSAVAVSFLDTGSVAIGSGTLAFSGPTDSFAGLVSGAGTLQFSGGATTIASGAKITAAKWSITGGGTTATLNESLAYAGVFAEGAGVSLSVASGDILALAGATTLSGTLTGAGALTTSGGATSVTNTAAISTARWTITGASTSVNINGGLIGYGGVLTLGAGATMNVASGDTLRLTGTSYVSGTIAGAGTLSIAGGAANFMSGAVVSAANWALQIAGSTTISENLSYGGTFSLAAAPTLGIAAADTFTLAGVSTINGLVKGTGALAMQGGSVTIAGGALFNVATWSMRGTAATIGKNLAYAGAFTAGGGAVLTLSGASAALTVEGHSVFDGATIAGAGAFVSAGPSGSLTISGLTIGGAVAWTNTRSIVETGGSLTMGDASGNAATLSNAKAGTFDITDDSDIALGSSTSSSISNVGILEKTGGSGDSVIAPNITNTGLIVVTSGELELGGSLSGAGSLQASAGATLQVDGAVAASQTFSYGSGAGEISLNDLDVGGAQLFHGAIHGWAAGDMLDVGTAFGAATLYAFTENKGHTGGTLSLSENGATAAIGFSGLSGIVTSANFTASLDAAGATLFAFHA